MTRVRKRKKGKPRGTAGRNPTGLRPGELLSEYPRLTVRVPERVRQLLKRTAAKQERQEWRVLVDAIEAYADNVLRSDS